MDDKQRLQLQNMIKTNNVEDQTDLIRNLKHSQVLRNEINTMIMIKAKYRGDEQKIAEECMNESNLDAIFEKEKVEPKKATVNVSWKQFKKMSK